ncbi:MAG: hypothetical protein H6R00_1592 [Proteobacteria bacterium]|nr:hypothetical protein [Pseudomonadota bacterium]
MSDFGQPQRTGLAWWRTSLSILGVSLLGLRTAVTSGSGWSLLAAAIGVLVALVMLARGWQRPLFREDRADVTTRQSRILMASVATAVSCVALLGGAELLLKWLAWS